MLKHLTLFTAMFLFVAASSFAQTIPQWQWAASGLASHERYTMDITTDRWDNVYITGSFDDTLTFPGDTLISRGDKDIYWAKFSHSGQFLWAASAGGIYDDEGTGIATDNYGNVYVASYFNDTAFYGIDTVKTKGQSDIVLAKYDNSGNRLWLKTWGSIYPDQGVKIAIDKHGKIFLTGTFAADGGSPPSHGTITFDNFNITSTGGGDIFLVKLDTNATIIWGTHAGGVFGDDAGNITLDSMGYIYVTGSFDAPWADFVNKRINAKFGPFNDMFVAQYDSTGYPVWVKGAGSLYPTGGSGVAVDGQGNVFVAGGCAARLPIKFENNLILDSTRGFVAKYDFTGNLVWAQRVDVWSNGWLSDVVTDPEDNIYTIGFFSIGFTFNGDTIAPNYDDLFVNKYDNNGTPLWTKEPMGPGSRGAVITLNNAGDVLVGGISIPGGPIFGPSTLPDSSAVLVAKLGSSLTASHLSASQADINIYPNPADNKLYISFNAEAPVHLKLHDLLGRTLTSEKITSDQPVIDISAVPPGLYYLQISGCNYNVCKKLIIQH